MDAAIRALAPFGRAISYGAANNDDGIHLRPSELIQKSISVIGMWLVHCQLRPEMMDEAIADLFKLAEAQKIRPTVQRLPLADVRRAHEDILARRAIGKIVLDVTDSH
jgi:NADPH2:quinone reductase